MQNQKKKKQQQEEENGQVLSPGQTRRAIYFRAAEKSFGRELGELGGLARAGCQGTLPKGLEAVRLVVQGDLTQGKGERSTPWRSTKPDLEVPAGRLFEEVLKSATGVWALK